MDFFSKTKVGDVVDRERSIVVVAATDCLLAAADLLTRHRITSAPVKNAEGSCVGFISLLDIVVYLNESVATEEAADEAGEEALGATSSAASWERFVRTRVDVAKSAQTALKGHVVGDALDRSGRNEFYSIKASAELKRAITFMQTHSQHRMAIINIITASDILRYVARNVSRLPPSLLATSLASIGFERQVVAVHQSRSILSALSLCAERRVTAVVVEDDKGALVGNLSAADLKHIDSARFLHLLEPLSSVVDDERTTPPHTITKDDTFELALLKLAFLGVHRLWLVDAAARRHVTGVVSVTDVLRFLDLRVYVSEEDEEVAGKNE